jgi:hypothetical protein
MRFATHTILSLALQIQEKKAKAGKLHRAKVDNKTGGITYTPANRKTPVCYDRHRHTLIEKTPEGDEVEVELDTDDEKENFKDISDSELVIRKTKKTKIVRGTKNKLHQKEEPVQSSEASATEESDDESDFEEEKAPIKKAKKTTTKASARGGTPTKARTTNDTSVDFPADGSDREEAVDEPKAPPRELHAAFSSPIVKSDWEDHQPDWRCTGAIDY